MPITSNYNPQNANQIFKRFMDTVRKRTIERLKYLGEMCVEEARISGNYMDQTGNLRSSIGYTVFDHGIAVHENFLAQKGGSEGVQAARLLAKKKGVEKADGIILIVVAGMNYALHVEARGYNVLTSSKLLAEKELPRMMESLRKNIIKATE